MRIGVLAIQGGFIEHLEMLGRLNVETVRVRLPADLEGLSGLIIPGGESTAIGKGLVDHGLLEPLKRRVQDGLPAFGTCAGMIILAGDSRAGETEETVPRLRAMDIEVVRNAFGRQLASFEQEIPIPILDGPPFHAVFIRAPAIRHLGPAAHAVARLEDGTAVAAQQGPLLGTAFHPELTDDTRLHEHFLTLCRAYPAP